MNVATTVQIADRRKNMPINAPEMKRNPTSKTVTTIETITRARPQSRSGIPARTTGMGTSQITQVPFTSRRVWLAVSTEPLEDPLTALKAGATSTKIAPTIDAAKAIS